MRELFKASQNALNTVKGIKALSEDLLKVIRVFLSYAKI